MTGCMAWVGWVLGLVAIVGGAPPSRDDRPASSDSRAILEAKLARSIRPETAASPRGLALEEALALATSDRAKALRLAEELVHEGPGADAASGKAWLGALELLAELHRAGWEASPKARRCAETVAPARAAVSTAGSRIDVPANPGAETCDQALDVGTVPPGIEEPGLLLVPGDHDWRTFTLQSSRRLRLETIGDPILSDTNLTLWGSCDAGVPRRRIAFGEDRSVFDYTTLVETTCLPAGRYFLDVGSFLDAGTPSPFALRVEDLGGCVAPAPDSYEPDDDLASAARLRLRKEHSGRRSHRGRQARTLAPPGDIDFVRFELPRAATVRLRAGSDENVNTLLGVGLADSGIVLGGNDDEAPGSAGSRFESCLPEGAWFAVVLPRIVGESFAYDLEAHETSKCVVESEPNGTLATANKLRIKHGVGKIHGTHLEGPTGPDRDFYRFAIRGERGVVLETSGYDGFDVDTFLELYDSAGALIASDDDGGWIYLSRIERALPEGTYFVNVTRSPFDPGDNWIYGLEITVGDPPRIEREPNDECQQAEPAALGERILGSLDPVGDRDRFRFQVPPAAPGGILVTIETDSTGDPVLRVHDDPELCASLLGCDDDSGPGLDPRFQCCLPGGADYEVEVSAFSGTVPFYALRLRGEGSCVPTGSCPIAPGQIGCP